MDQRVTIHGFFQPFRKLKAEYYDAGFKSGYNYGCEDIEYKVNKAFAIANNAIYFSDNSNYLKALYQVCKVLNPSIDDEDIGEEYIGED